MEVTSLKQNWMNERKSRLLETANRSAADKDKERLRKVLESFKSNSLNKKLIKSVYFKLMNSASGRALRLFNNWKALPNRNLRDDLLGKAANELERKLGLLVFRRLKAVNDPLKEQMVRGELIQKQVCKDIINKTMSAQKRMFLHWSDVVKSFRTVQTVNKAHLFFNRLNDVITANSRGVLYDSNSLRKLHFINLLVKSLQAKKRDGFLTWKHLSANKGTETAFMLRIKRHLIESISVKRSLNDERLVSNALNKFAINAKHQKFVASIYQKLLGTSSGKMLLLFNRWKALPERKGTNMAEIAF